MEAGTAPLDAPRTREVDLEAREEKRSATARRGTPSLRFWDGFSVFAIFAAIYFIIGYKVVVELHVVNFDSLSRLAHAYFVWFNDPAKLAAIGFVWPPVQTLIYLPFALFGELATSLAALPAASATFMAATVLMISHALRACGVPWLARWPLLLGFGLNPMIVYYGANGMAESVYLFFLTFAIFFLIRWRQTHQNHLLAFVGFGVGLSMLSRYEIVPFAIVFALGIALVILTTWQRSERARSIESGLVLYLAPVIYFGLTWLFFNWLIRCTSSPSARRTRTCRPRSRTSAGWRPGT
jgi:ABC-type multidrug transport system fused ATPase/permease subunit